MKAEEQCTERVFSGARWDMGGHQCGRKRMDGSVYCRQHHLKHNPEPLQQDDQKVAPAWEEGASLTTVLKWGESQGPVLVKWAKRWSVRQVTITMNVRTCTPYLKWYGAQVKKDGTESKGNTNHDYADPEDFPLETQNLLHDKIRGMQSLAADVAARLV